MRRTESIVVALLGLAGLSGLGFAVVFLLGADTQLLGIALGAGLLLVGVALVIASRHLVPDRTETEERAGFGDEREAEGLREDIAGAGKRISRRRLVLGAGAAAAGGLGAGVALPLASLGPSVGDTNVETPWSDGVGVVDEEGVAIRVTDIDVGAFVTGFPEGADRRQLGSPVVLVKLEPADLDPPPEREGWDAEGVVAFSKICTHAGCAIDLYRYPLYAPTTPGPPALVCPCHYSTFEPGAGGRRIFGPAGRDLPQLPLRTDESGSLVAAGGFSGAVGPAWWGVRKQEGEDS